MMASSSASALSTATCAAYERSSQRSAASPSRPSTALVTGLRSIRARPRLWMVFAAVGGLALTLLAGGLAWVRLYDNQLIRQTESELIAEAVVVAEVFAGELHGGGSPEAAGDLVPILPTLRASSPVLPAPDDPPASAVPPDTDARKAGEGLNAMLQRVRRSTLS